MVDQNPIGKSSRSNPVTYIKATTKSGNSSPTSPMLQHNGLGPSAFSFNIAGGRCEECQGEGVIKGIDAVHGRCRTGLRSLRRKTFPRRDPRSQVPRPVDLRRPGDDHRRGHRFLRRGSPQTPPASRIIERLQPPAGCRTRVHQARTILLDPLRRRETACETRLVPHEGCRAGRRDVHLRRTHHRAPFPRHLEAPRGVQRP